MGAAIAGLGNELMAPHAVGSDGECNECDNDDDFDNPRGGV